MAKIDAKRELKKYVKISSGFAFKSENFNTAGNGLPLIRIRDIQNNETNTYYDGKYDERFLVKNGDFLIGMDGEFNIVKWTGGKALLNQRVCKVEKISNEIDLKFVFYFLKIELKKIEELTPFVTVKHISASKILSLEIQLPTLLEQKRIVSILEKAEKLKEEKRVVNSLCRKFPHSLFWAKFGKNEPNKRIGDIVEMVSSGSTPLGGQKVYSDKGILFIRSQNVLMNKLDLSDAVYINNEINSKMERTWVKKGDVLLNITGASLGRVSFYDSDVPANVNQHVCIIRLDKNVALPEYISYYLSSPQAQGEMWGIQSGASRQALNFKQVKSLKIFLPDITKQKEFVDITKLNESMLQKQQQAENDVNNLFNSLMQNTFRSAGDTQYG